jgi:hypothetical protein
MHHYVRDISFGEGTETSRTGQGPVNLATIRAAIKDAGYLHIPEGRRDHLTPADAFYLHASQMAQTRWQWLSSTGRDDLTLHNAHYRRSTSQRHLPGCGRRVPSHGTCRISLIMPGDMSDGGSYDMNLRRQTAGGCSP